MDFAWKPEHDAFRERLREFLAAHLPSDWAERSNYDTSAPYVAEFARTFCPKLAQAGLLIPHWPVEHGGAGLDAFHHWILGEEMFAVGEPRSYQYFNVNWLGPAILRYGTEEQKREHIPRITGGTVFWCQGFSEPSAGSDLASLRTRAEKTAHGYVINGSKIWTSAASFADYCFLLARTGSEKRSITVFLLPMNTPGIEVKVIPGLAGARSFHEVFLTNVEVPQSAVLGEEGQGWKVVSSVMHNERIGVPRYALTIRALEHAVELLKQRGRFKDALVRAKAGLARAACDAARYACLKIIDARVKSHPPSAETSVARYLLVLADRAVCEFIANFLQPELIANDDAILSAAYRRTSATGIAAGAAEIQLNLIARDYLDLPREPQLQTQPQA